MRFFKSISFGFYLSMFLLTHLAFIGLNVLIFSHNFAISGNVFGVLLQKIFNNVFLLSYTGGLDEDATLYIKVFLYGLLFSFIAFSVFGYFVKKPCHLIKNLTLCLALFLVILLPFISIINTYIIAVDICIIAWYIVTIVYKNVLPLKSNFLISTFKILILILIIFYVLSVLFTSVGIVFNSGFEEATNVFQKTYTLAITGLKLLVFTSLLVGYIYSNGYHRPSFGVFWLRMFALVVVFFQLSFIIFILILLANQFLLAKFIFFVSWNDNFMLFLKGFIFLNITLCFSIALRDGVAKARFGLKRFMELSLSSGVFLIISFLFFYLMSKNEIPGANKFLNVFLFCLIFGFLNTFLLFIYRSKTQRLYKFLQIILRYMYLVAFLCVCGFVFLEFSLLFLSLAALVFIYGFKKALKIKEKKLSKITLRIVFAIAIFSGISSFMFIKYKENLSKTTETQTRFMCDKTREILIDSGYCKDIVDCKIKRLVGYSVDGNKAFIYIHIDKSDVSEKIINAFKSYKKTNKIIYEIYFFKKGLEVSPFFDEATKQATLKVLI